MEEALRVLQEWKRRSGCCRSGRGVRGVAGEEEALGVLQEVFMLFCGYEKIGQATN